MWIALAGAQVETGSIQPDVAGNALAVMDDNIAYWHSESSPEDASHREAVLAELKARIEGPRTSPRPDKS